MVQISDDVTMKFVILVTIAWTTEPVFANSNAKEQRPYYYARVSKDLNELARRDYETMMKLKSFREHPGQPLSLVEIVNNYLQDFSNSTTSNMDGINVTEHVEEIARNPLAMFRLMSRAAHFLNAKAEGRELISDVQLEKIRESYDRNRVPLKDDLVDAAYAILRIQFMYNLSASDLAAGRVRGMETKTKLLAVDCLYIGLIAKFRMEFTVAVEWLKVAKMLARIDGTADIPTVQTELIDTIKEHDQIWKRQGFTDEYFFMKPLKSLHLVDKENIPSVRDVLQREYAGKGRNSSYWPMNTWGLCSAENFHTPQALSYLFCWLEFKVNKIYTIGPLKMEFLSRNPDVVQIHQAFTPANVRESMAEIGSSGSPNLGHTMEEQLNKKVESMTGLRSAGPNVSDRAKIINHVPGGNEDIHMDLLVLKEGGGNNEGVQIASFLIQLNNVDEGGYIAFPTTLATAVPNKGSAIFWFNTFSDGTPDFSTAHAHCPVVLGQKWAIRKRVRFNDQFSIRKCSLQPKERFIVLVNGREIPVPATFRHELIDQEAYENPQLLSVVSEAPAEYYKMEEPRKKFASRPTSALKLLIRLDWELYVKIKRISSTLLEQPVNLQVQQGHDPQMNQMIRSYLNDFNETAYNSILEADPGDVDTVDKLSGNPIAVYRTFWRFENFVKPWVTEELQEQSEIRGQIRDCIQKLYSPSDGPAWADYEDVMTGILNLQFVHDLKSDQIGKGVVAGIDAVIVLSAKQCIEIGHHAIAKDFYYQAIDWMTTAVNKVTTEADTTVDLKDAQAELETAKQVHDKILAKSHANERTFYVGPVGGLRNLRAIRTRKEILHNSYRYRNESELMDINWIEACQGKPRQTAAERSKLFCWQETEIHPFFKIGPIKMEIHSMLPKSQVVEYHEVLGERLMTYLKNDTGREFFVSTSKGYGATDTRARISAAHFMRDENSQDFKRIQNLVTLVTGLRIEREGLNINSYAPGGHFAIHTDSKGIGVDGTSAALGTFIFYLTEAEKGGGTAFAQAGVHAAPKAGSALFWYNTFASGLPDTQTYHGGCPVIFGEKRIATQFLTYGDQSHLKCQGGVRQKMQVLVNGKSKHANV